MNGPDSDQILPQFIDGPFDGAIVPAPLRADNRIREMFGDRKRVAVYDRTVSGDFIFIREELR